MQGTTAEGCIKCNNSCAYLCLAARQPRWRSRSSRQKALCSCIAAVWMCKLYTWMPLGRRVCMWPRGASQVCCSLCWWHCSSLCVKATVTAASCVTLGLGHQPSCAGRNEAIAPFARDCAPLLLFFFLSLFFPLPVVRWSVGGKSLDLLLIMFKTGLMQYPL